MTTSKDITADQGSRPLARRDVLRKGALATGATIAGISALSGTSLAGCTVSHECARTPGFWQRHTDMWHGGPYLYLGHQKYYYGNNHSSTNTNGTPTVYTILTTPARGDKTIIMATHLIATMLNLRAGTDPDCIEETVYYANKWLCEYPVGSGARHWYGGEHIKNRLDAYNNGYLCACGGD